MKISVIIPIYNVSEYIERCINSILRQKYQNLEVILVDDCSPDNSLDIAKNALDKSGLEVKYISHKENRGLSAARNSGIKEASGDYLYFLDSDDELTIDSLEILARRSDNADCIVGNYKVEKLASRYTSKRYNVNRILTKEIIIKAFANGDIPVMAWNKLVRRDFVIKNDLLFREGLINEDELWSFKLVICADKIIQIADPTYIYYIRENSIMTNSKKQKVIESAITIYEELVAEYLRSSINNTSLHKYLDNFAIARFRQILNISDINNQYKKELYRRVRLTQKQIGFMGSRSLIFNFHLLLPSNTGYYWLNTMYSLIALLKKK